MLFLVCSAFTFGDTLLDVHSHTSCAKNSHNLERPYRVSMRCKSMPEMAMSSKMVYQDQKHVIAYILKRVQ